MSEHEREAASAKARSRASARVELERLASERHVVAVMRDEETVTVLLAGVALDAEPTGGSRPPR